MVMPTTYFLATSLQNSPEQCHAATEPVPRRFAFWGTVRRNDVCMFKAIRLEKSTKTPCSLPGWNSAMQDFCPPCTAREGVGFGSSGRGSAVHSQQLMKVPMFYNSSSDLLLRCNKPQSLAL